MFGLHRKKEEKIEINKPEERAVLRVSICTGEKTGCIQNLRTKKLRDVMLIRDQKDLETFARLTETGLEEIEEIW